MVNLFNNQISGRGNANNNDTTTNCNCREGRETITQQSNNMKNNKQQSNNCGDFM